MFVIPNMFIEDKNLPKVLTAIVGLVIGMDVPRPVVNAVVKQGKVRQASPETATWKRVADQITAAHQKGDRITPIIVKDAITACQGSPTSYSYYIKALIDEGVVKRTKDRGVYILQ